MSQIAGIIIAVLLAIAVLFVFYQAWKPGDKKYACPECGSMDTYRLFLPSPPGHVALPRYSCHHCRNEFEVSLDIQNPIASEQI